MSEVKVNKISPRTNCGTVTLGDSGDTFTIPAGATITNNGTAAGFGATGAASWDTTVKTSGFTAVSGVGYFVDTTSGAISVNLPAGTAGDVVAIKDYANTFDTNAVTLVQNGSDKIGGSAINAVLSTEGLAVTLVYVDATQGWLITDSGLQSEAPQPTFITATGGTITTCGNFKIHTFNSPGTFTVSCLASNPANNQVDYLVIAGGGGGGHGQACYQAAGGGGAGGYRESSGAASGCYTVSPLGACVSALPVTSQGYPITVGAGGAGAPAQAAPNPGSVNGSNSVFSTITSAGGGYGRGYCNQNGNPGGSGGGAGTRNNPSVGLSPATAGTGNTPPVSPPQGNNGGRGTQALFQANHSGGGGGGATVSGGNGCATGPGGNGGAGGTSSINGTPTGRAGGGSGSSDTNNAGSVSDGGGAGGGAPFAPSGRQDGSNGTANTGGGGGGGAVACSPGNSAGGGAGGSGVVIIRYKFQ